jgi:hypothetical protein
VEKLYCFIWWLVPWRVIFSITRDLVAKSVLGFYDNYVQTNYYDDLWVFDTMTYKWTKIEMPAVANRPT